MIMIPDSKFEHDLLALKPMYLKIRRQDLNGLSQKHQDQAHGSCATLQSLQASPELYVLHTVVYFCNSIQTFGRSSGWVPRGRRLMHLCIEISPFHLFFHKEQSSGQLFQDALGCTELHWNPGVLESIWSIRAQPSLVAMGAWWNENQVSLLPDKQSMFYLHAH